MYLSHAIGLGKCTNSNNLSHATSPNKIAPLPTRHNGNRKTNHLVSSQITRLTIQEPVTLLLQMNMIENGDVDLMMYLFEPTQFLVACYVTLHLLCQSVGVSFHPSVRWSVHWSHISFLFFCLFFLVVFGLCSCPNDLVTSITVPAHPHKTGVAVDPALFVFVICWRIWMLWVDGWMDIGSDGQMD